MKIQGAISYHPGLSNSTLSLRSDSPAVLFEGRKQAGRGRDAFCHLEPTDPCPRQRRSGAIIGLGAVGVGLIGGGGLISHAIAAPAQTATDNTPNRVLAADSPTTSVSAWSTPEDLQEAEEQISIDSIDAPDSTEQDAPDSTEQDAQATNGNANTITTGNNDTPATLAIKAKEVYPALAALPDEQLLALVIENTGVEANQILAPDQVVDLTEEANTIEVTPETQSPPPAAEPAPAPAPPAAETPPPPPAAEPAPTAAPQPSAEDVERAKVRNPKGTVYGPSLLAAVAEIRADEVADKAGQTAQMATDKPTKQNLDTAKIWNGRTQDQLERMVNFTDGLYNGVTDAEKADAENLEQSLRDAYNATNNRLAKVEAQLNHDDARDKLVATAKKYVGISESDDPGTVTRFNNRNASGTAPYVPWCAAFMSTVAEEALGSSPFGYIEGVAALYTWAQDNGRVVETPQKGDLVLYRVQDSNARNNHVGMVTQVNGNGTYDQLGGNQSDAVTERQGESINDPEVVFVRIVPA